MSNPADSTVQNLLPVQAYFDVDGNFQTFIGQGQPFSATIDPDQSGLHITNSTIDSSPIGSITPSTGSFTSGQVAATPTGSTDIANKLYVDSVASGLSWKQPFQVATVAPITLSGFPIVDTYQTVAGDRVLVKNQANAAQNGIYIASSGSWSYATDGDSWNEYISAIGFVEYGSQKGSAWYCSAQGGGTLGVTDLNWSNFSVAGTYFAGTGLTLAAYTFSITNTGVTAGSYGTDARSVTLAINAQGQITSAIDQPIAIANTQVSGLGTMSTQNANSVAITGGTINGAPIGGTTAAAVTGTTITAGTQFTGPGTGLTGTATGLSIGGNAATATLATSATTATTSTNLAGGASGSLPYQSAAGSTSFLAAGTNGQVLTLAAGVPSWATPTTGTVTSVSGTGTVNGLTLTGTVTSSGILTLGGTLDLSSPPAIGGTTASTVRGTTITATSQFSGPGTGLTGTASSLSIGGNAATATSATTATNIAGGLANQIHYQTGAGATSFITAPTVTSSYLGWNGSAFAWSTISAGLTVTDDTTTNATRYLTFTSATSGTISGINTSSTELKWNPSLGIMDLSGATGALTVPTGTTAQRPASPVVGMQRWNTTLQVFEMWTGSQWNIITSANYTITYLIVAGGGGGAGTAGGGGGGGGLLTNTTTVVPTTAYTIVVGAGGSGASAGANNGTVGSNSSGFTFTANGGGYGGSGVGGSGGSGGGGGTGLNAGGAGTSGQGYAGGTGNTNGTTYNAGGGGGGAGSVGTGATNSNASGGAGGAGASSSISGSAVYYAGGGGGGGNGNQSGVGGAGGTGGGGHGAYGTIGNTPTGFTGTAGSTNLGGGGGGGGSDGASGAYSGFAGGSGIVIISYAGAQRGTGGTVTSAGGNTIHTFTTSGTYTA